MWRDSGYAFGALAIGGVSDFISFNFGFYFTAVIMCVSGAVDVRDRTTAAEGRARLAREGVL